MSFMKTKGQAEELAKALTEVGSGAGLEMRAVLTVYGIVVVPADM